jgi:hypothetical protein
MEERKITSMSSSMPGTRSRASCTSTTLAHTSF